MFLTIRNILLCEDWELEDGELVDLERLVATSIRLLSWHAFDLHIVERFVNLATTRAKSEYTSWNHEICQLFLRNFLLHTWRIN